MPIETLSLSFWKPVAPAACMVLSVSRDSHSFACTCLAGFGWGSDEHPPDRGAVSRLPARRPSDRMGHPQYRKRSTLLKPNFSVRTCSSTLNDGNMAANDRLEKWGLRPEYAAGADPLRNCASRPPCARLDPFPIELSCAPSIL